MLPMTEEEAAWRRAWLKKRGKEPSGWNWLDAGAAYRDHLRDLRDSNLSDLSNPPNRELTGGEALRSDVVVGQQS